MKKHLLHLLFFALIFSAAVATADQFFHREPPPVFLEFRKPAHSETPQNNLPFSNNTNNSNAEHGKRDNPYPEPPDQTAAEQALIEALREQAAFDELPRMPYPEWVNPDHPLLLAGTILHDKNPERLHSAIIAITGIHIDNKRSRVQTFWEAFVKDVVSNAFDKKKGYVGLTDKQRFALRRTYEAELSEFDWVRFNEPNDPYLNLRLDGFYALYPSLAITEPKAIFSGFTLPHKNQNTKDIAELIKRCEVRDWDGAQAIVNVYNARIRESDTPVARNQAALMRGLYARYFEPLVNSNLDIFDIKERSPELLKIAKQLICVTDEMQRVDLICGQLSSDRNDVYHQFFDGPWMRCYCRDRESRFTSMTADVAEPLSTSQYTPERILANKLQCFDTRSCGCYHRTAALGMRCVVQALQSPEHRQAFTQAAQSIVDSINTHRVHEHADVPVDYDALVRMSLKNQTPAFFHEYGISEAMQKTLSDNGFDHESFAHREATLRDHLFHEEVCAFVHDNPNAMREQIIDFIVGQAKRYAPLGFEQQNTTFMLDLAHTSDLALLQRTVLNNYQKAQAICAEFKITDPNSACLVRACEMASLSPDMHLVYLNNHAVADPDWFDGPWMRCYCSDGESRFTSMVADVAQQLSSSQYTPERILANRLQCLDDRGCGRYRDTAALGMRCVVQALKSPEDRQAFTQAAQSIVETISTRSGREHTDVPVDYDALVRMSLENRTPAFFHEYQMSESTQKTFSNNGLDHESFAKRVATHTDHIVHQELLAFVCDNSNATREQIIDFIVGQAKRCAPVGRELQNAPLTPDLAITSDLALLQSTLLNNYQKAELICAEFKITEPNSACLLRACEMASLSPDMRVAYLNNHLCAVQNFDEYHHWFDENQVARCFDYDKAIFEHIAVPVELSLSEYAAERGLFCALVAQNKNAPAHEEYTNLALQYVAAACTDDAHRGIAVDFAHKLYELIGAQNMNRTGSSVITPTEYRAIYEVGKASLDQNRDFYITLAHPFNAKAQEVLRQTGRDPQEMLNYGGNQIDHIMQRTLMNYSNNTIDIDARMLDTFSAQQLDLANEIGYRVAGTKTYEKFWVREYVNVGTIFCTTVACNIPLGMLNTAVSTKQNIPTTILGTALALGTKMGYVALHPNAIPYMVYPYAQKTFNHICESKDFVELSQRIGQAAGETVALLVVDKGIGGLGTAAEELIGNFKNQGPPIIPAYGEVGVSVPVTIPKNPSFAETLVWLKGLDGSKQSGNAQNGSIHNPKSDEQKIVEVQTKKQMYQNMGEFFKSDFGKTLRDNCQKTNYLYKGQRVFRVTEAIKDTALRKGDYFYLDSLHFDHIECFGKVGEFRAVINFDGTLNVAKTNKAAQLGRQLQL